MPDHHNQTLFHKWLDALFLNDLIDLAVNYYKENEITETSKDEIFKTCDFVTINTPHNADTDNMVDMKVLKSMKNSAYIINIARGGIINETDLKKALKNNIIAAINVVIFASNIVDKALLYPF